MKIFILSFWSLFAFIGQPAEETDSLFCPSYTFRFADTLIYLLHSYDSVVVDFGKPLLKVRNEVYRFICDSILEGSKYRLRCELIEFRGIDYEDTNKVEYWESEWIGRKVWYVVDTTGERYSFSVDDSLRSGKAPGGFFQPHLFFKFSDGCKKKNETWLIRTIDDLPENGIPVSTLRNTMLFKMIGEKDTLAEQNIRMEFIRTGQGRLKLNNPILPMELTGVINSFGVLDISKSKKIPTHLFTTVEQKLTLNSNDKVSRIMHYISSYYTLIEYKEGSFSSTKQKSKKRKG
ncbi:MAG: hypothetical protein ACUVQ1_07600 [Candidatus Kapaibacteriales bacterium]